DLRQVYNSLQVIDAVRDPSGFSLEKLAEQAGRHSQLERVVSLHNLVVARWWQLCTVPLVLGAVYLLWSAEDQTVSAPPDLAKDAYEAWMQATSQRLAEKQ